MIWGHRLGLVEGATRRCERRLRSEAVGAVDLRVEAQDAVDLDDELVGGAAREGGDGLDALGAEGGGTGQWPMANGQRSIVNAAPACSD